MIVRLAMRSLLSRPVRSAVLAGGFGLGVAVMAALLGIGRVILDQARAPELVGGGDVVIGGVSGRVANARFVLASVLGAEPLASQVVAAAPAKSATLYLVGRNGVTPLRARGGIPSLEGALHDPETSPVPSWRDTPADRAWAAPDPGEILREMDRFHPVPDVPARADSWAEWLYFNGRATDARFYLSFIAGPRLDSGRRTVGVRLQLERNGHMTAFSDSAEVDAAALLETAPDLTVGPNRVRLVGAEYRIAIDLPAESGRSRASGEIVVRAVPGRALPPFAIRGAGGWVSGYTVPVIAGGLDGTLSVGGERIDLRGGTGYHDHNWGFWEGVSWQWGQVQHEGLSIVYGRVRPPEDAADPSRIPGFLIAIGPEGPLGFATDVRIEERFDTAAERPRQILVRGRSESIDLTLELAIEQATVTRRQQRGFGPGLNFFQLRAQYRVTGRAGEVAIDFEAPGSAETFRGR